MLAVLGSMVLVVENGQVVEIFDTALVAFAPQHRPCALFERAGPVSFDHDPASPASTNGNGAVLGSFLKSVEPVVDSTADLARWLTASRQFAQLRPRSAQPL